MHTCILKFRVTSRRQFFCQFSSFTTQCRVIFLKPYRSNNLVLKCRTCISFLNFKNFDFKNLSTEVDKFDVIENDPLHEDIQKLYRYHGIGHNLMLIQPRVKYGAKFEAKQRAEIKLDEAVALVESLPHWKVIEKHVTSCESLKSSLLFGKGNLEKLKLLVHSNTKISGVFIGINMLSALQSVQLEKFFGVPVFDRYQIVLRIFRDHAKTKEAKLQFALAEIPYLRIKLAGFFHTKQHGNFLGIDQVGGTGEMHMAKRKELLLERELKLKKALEKLRKQRQFLRKNEKRSALPIIAVVGYTNCGKTTLIKSLTEDTRLIPEDKLFATLDVTLHAGLLPSLQKVLYIDTVGFISDIPTTLIESFKATLEDIAYSDLIIHVRDISHPDTEMQKKVVLETLNELNLPSKLLDNIIEVGNKIDKVQSKEETEDENMLLISATKGDGLPLLLESIQDKILENTDHDVKLFRIPNGGAEYEWLYKEATITNAIIDEKDANYLIVETVISDSAFSRFKHCFGDVSVCISDIT